MKREKLLRAMRDNPQGDWRIGDVERVCRDFGIDCSPPRRGDHYKVSHGSQPEILTVPAARPIKTVYIKKLVSFVEAVVSHGDAGQ